MPVTLGRQTKTNERQKLNAAKTKKKSKTIQCQRQCAAKKNMKRTFDCVWKLHIAAHPLHQIEEWEMVSDGGLIGFVVFVSFFVLRTARPNECWSSIHRSNPSAMHSFLSTHCVWFGLTMAFTANERRGFATPNGTSLYWGLPFQIKL